MSNVEIDRYVVVAGATFKYTLNEDEGAEAIDFIDGFDGSMLSLDEAKTLANELGNAIAELERQEDPLD